MSQKPILALDNVVKRFGGIYALNKVSMQVEHGKILGLIGPNGSGKTTLFNVITGMYTPEAGKIYFDGEDITGFKPHEVARRGVGRTFQIVRPFGDMTVFENLLVSGLFSAKTRIEKRSKVEERCHEILKITNLTDRANTQADMLRFAEKRRLEIARALALEPKLLLLDETMAGLNPTEVDQALHMIMDIKNRFGLTIIVVEHVMRAIMTISDWIVVLSEGSKIAEGTPREVSENENVLRIYLGERTNIKGAS
ncbi:MAG: ABC transporter ATP-binding protein [Candidatus Bathyarchaeia archaeon]